MPVLTRDIEAAVERLRAAFDVEEVILFGSRAYGTPRPDSDADLVLVLRPTGQSQQERAARVVAVLADGERLPLQADVFAYTVPELRERLQHGNTAILDALEQGTVLYPDRRASRYAVLAREWSAMGAREDLLDKARDDLFAAGMMLEAGARRQIWWAAAFHAQQAGENALKALIYHLGGRPERTHSLAALADAAARLDAAVGRPFVLRYGGRLGELTRYAAQSRYKDAPPVSEALARQAVETAAGIVTDVEAAVGR